MLHNLAQYTCQGDGPIVGRITFTTLLEDRANISFFQSAGIFPVVNDLWNSNWMTGAISSLSSFRTTGFYNATL